MTATAQTFEFQTEARQLLDLMIHSVYSNRDIFLRELISNSSDALDKLRIEALRGDEIAMPVDAHIRIEADRATRTLSVIDNGVGMSRDELIQNIGTIARSGTREFMEALRASKEGGTGVPAELIGQFGVGFYSTFMVADRVSILTRRVGEQGASFWESTGDGTYTLQESERPEHGTTVMLHLKANEGDDDRDYLDEWVIRSIVKKYSDFVTYPIRMRIERTEPERDENGAIKEGGVSVQTVEDQVLNSMKALWTRPKEQVTQEEYSEFYRHISHDWQDPLTVFTVRAEGTFEYYALLFIPQSAPFDLFHIDRAHGLQLYVKRIFILDEAKDLVPTYLRFLRGVVDAEDLPLNISREILQENRQIRMIRNRIARKTIETLGEMLRTDREKYRTFWGEFGAVLKEGIFQDQENRDQLLDVALFATTASGELTTLGEYVARMKDGQEAIYFITGESREVAARSPHLEAFAARGVEVLLLSDPVDEIWTSGELSYQGKALRSAARGAVEVGSEEERKRDEERRQEGMKTYGQLLDALKEHLKEHVSEVRLSSRLTSSAVCLVSNEHDVSPQMARILKAMGQEAPKAKRIMELNPGHPLMERMQSIVATDAGAAGLHDYAELLYGQALLAEGQLPDNPAEFSRLVADVMVRAGG